MRIVTKTLTGSSTNGPDSAKPRTALDLLASLGCSIEYLEARPVSYLVIDRELVWFGSIPPLAFPQKDDCSVRFRNAEVAHELAGGCDASDLNQ